MGEIVALNEFPKAVSGLLLDTGTIRWGYWKVPEEMSVGQVAEVDVAFAVGVLEAGVEVEVVETSLT